MGSIILLCSCLLNKILQVNNGDVDLEKGRTNEFTCYTAVNPFYVRLLRRDNRAKMQLQSPKERANSSISNRNIRKRKNKGKENQAPFGSSPSAPNSSCRFALKFGKVSGTRCTPESKKRRKSRIVEPVELHTALWCISSTVMYANLLSLTRCTCNDKW